MHPFRKFIQSYVVVSDSDWEKIEAVLLRKEYLQGEILLREGQYCQKLYFLEDGFLRYFVYKKDGEEATKFFTIAPYCFTSQRSFTSNNPSTENIQALENSIVWEMDQSAAFDLLELKSWSEFIRKLIQEVQFYTEEILLELQNKTAEDRYIKMLTESSIILQKSPLKYVASYLGIAPQSLSRIRKKFYSSRRS